ncbi:uroporphyrinogen decarboxylase family protein [Oscillospiraceae bacterium MB08-C2-2]|nr:uroporphyrinogen decarboxylase family protein [Oscillospiraceae bacterium MB08-C2-2]
MSNKQFVFNAFDNKEVERVPVGFWFHFIQGEEIKQGLENADILQKSIEGHKKFVGDFGPDFVKLMSDGFFAYPNPILLEAKKAGDLRELKPLGVNHPWIQKQVELVKTLTDAFGDDLATFYNIFAPATFFKILLNEKGNQVLADFITEDKEAVKYALDVIAQDLAVLSQQVITAAKADGIYLSVQNIQDARITKEIYQEVVAPSEKKVLEGANEVSSNNILHICGFKGNRNDLSWYTDYNAKAINWAVTVENVSLSEGKKLFGGKAVIGGFNNTESGLLNTGSQAEVEEYTQKLLEEAGKTGVILGADCTVPSNIDLARLEWVRSKAAAL